MHQLKRLTSLTETVTTVSNSSNAHELTQCLGTESNSGTAAEKVVTLTSCEENPFEAGN